MCLFMFRGCYRLCKAHWRDRPMFVRVAWVGSYNSFEFMPFFPFFPFSMSRIGRDHYYVGLPDIISSSKTLPAWPFHIAQSVLHYIAGIAASHRTSADLTDRTLASSHPPKQNIFRVCFCETTLDILSQFPCLFVNHRCSPLWRGDFRYTKLFVVIIS